MKQKVIKYTILLLLIPVIISIFLSFMQMDEEKKYPNDNYDGMDIPTYSDTKVDEIKRSNPYVYVSIFGLLIVAGGVWYYVKKKGEF